MKKSASKFTKTFKKYIMEGIDLFIAPNNEEVLAQQADHMCMIVRY